MTSYDYSFEDTKLETNPLTRDAHAAVEWIKKCNQWKTEQEEGKGGQERKKDTP